MRFPRATRRWHLVLFVVGLSMLTWSGCGRSLGNRLLLFPSGGRIPTPGAAERWVESPTGRVQVFIAPSEATMRPAVEPARFVLRLEGNGGRAEYTAVPVAQRWADEPTEVWAMNWPGFGQSDGPATLDRLAPAATATYEALWLRAAGRPVFVDADSMGTAVALHLAATQPDQGRPPSGLVLKNPPPLRSLLQRRHGWWNLWIAAGQVALALPRELDSLTNAAHARAPAIFLTAERDSLVPPRFQQLVIGRYAGPVRVVVLPAAEHNTPIDPQSEAALRQHVVALFAGR